MLAGYITNDKKGLVVPYFFDSYISDIAKFVYDAGEDARVQICNIDLRNGGTTDTSNLLLEIADGVAVRCVNYELGFKVFNQVAFYKQNGIKEDEKLQYSSQLDAFWKKGLRYAEKDEFFKKGIKYDTNI